MPLWIAIQTRSLTTFSCQKKIWRSSITHTVYESSLRGVWQIGAQTGTMKKFPILNLPKIMSPIIKKKTLRKVIETIKNSARWHLRPIEVNGTPVLMGIHPLTISNQKEPKSEQWSMWLKKWPNGAASTSESGTMTRISITRGLVWRMRQNRWVSLRKVSTITWVSWGQADNAVTILIRTNTSKLEI